MDFNIFQHQLKLDFGWNQPTSDIETQPTPAALKMVTCRLPTTRACLKMLGSPRHILDVLLSLILFYIAQWSENGINWGSEIWWWFTINIGVFDQRSAAQMSICHGQHVGWMWCRVMHPIMGIQTWTTIPQSSASYFRNLTMGAYGSHWL